MSQKIQKILIRSVLLGTLVFGVVFVLFESKVSQYQGSTLFAISARSEVGAQQMEIVAENVEIILQNELFRQEVSNAFYEKTGEWKRFSLDVKNPAGSVFVLSYEDNSVDPYTIREAIEVVRIEAFKTIARNYDFSRDFSMHFLDSGKVVESNKILYHIGIAGFFTLLLVIFIEGSFYLRSVRKSEEEFRLVLQKRMLEKEEPSEWWKNFEPKEESKKSIFPEITAVEEVSEKRAVSSLTQESKPKNDPQVNRVFSGSARGKAPENLPIAVMPALEGVDMSASNAVNNIAQQNEEFSDADVMVLDEPVRTKKVAVNPEPSIEELKERLNKLLRGEL